MSTTKQRFLPLLPFVAALAFAGHATSASANQCSQIEADYNRLGNQIRQQCNQIRLSLNWSACRGIPDSRSCFKRLRAPHDACLKRNHENAMTKFRKVDQCHRYHAARRGHGSNSGYNAAYNGAQRFNSSRAPSLSKRLTRFSLKAVRKVANGALIGLKGAMDMTNAIGQHMPTYTYTPTYRSGGGSTYRSGGSSRSGGTPRCNTGNSRC
jgi:hypothetical protein